MNLSSISKAIAGGLVGLGVAEAARFGWQPSPTTRDSANVLLTAVIGYIVGHVIVYFFPANK